MRKSVSLVADLRGPLVRLAFQGQDETEAQRHVECLSALQSFRVRAQKTVRSGLTSGLTCLLQLLDSLCSRVLTTAAVLYLLEQ